MKLLLRSAGPAFCAALLGSCAPNTLPSSPAETGMLSEGRARVVFVHGIFQDGGTSFGLLRRRLEGQGIACFSPSLKPRDARNGMIALAHQLKERIDRQYGPNQRITMVGFSMGGLIGRYYLQELGGAARCDALYTVATPHHGTGAGVFYLGQGSRDLMPESEFIRTLHRGEDRLGRMRLVSYRSPYDLAMLPPSTCIWDKAENISVPVLIHPMLTRSDAVVEGIEGEILRRTSGTERRSGRKSFPVRESP